MTALHLIFYVFSTLAIGSGMLVVGSGNPVRGALFLVLTFFAMAGIWLTLYAEFLALVLVLVYVGAVMTLFLFVVMMLSVDRVRLKESFVRYLPIALLIVVMIVGLTLKVVGTGRFSSENMPVPVVAADYNNIASLGMLLYTHYVYPFEIAAVLLLTAIVAAISLTHRARKRHKSQEASAQIAVKAADRLRLIDLPSGTKYKPTQTGQ